MIVIIDFGSQTAHLIARRIRDLGWEAEIVSPKLSYTKASSNKPQGIILSGGPSSVYSKKAPSVDKKIFDLGIPVLGICYGLQLTAKLLGGKVISGRKEYGPSELKISNFPGLPKRPLRLGEARSGADRFQISNGLPESFTVWLSHGDEVVLLPKGFQVVGSTESVKYAFVGDIKRNIYGVQFHPEVEHTEFGLRILQNFIDICDGEANIKTGEEYKVHPPAGGSKFKVITQSSKLNIDKLIEEIRKTVGESYVIGAVSGGVDSTVAGVLTARAIEKRFIPIYVENGLMREGAVENLKKIFGKYGTKPIVVNAVGETLSRLSGISDPELKRKIIGNFYIEIFEGKMQQIIKSGKDIKFLMQGTIYSDVIESKGTTHASRIKSHHNVGALPKNMKLELLEPLRYLYKDQVRQIGKNLGLSDEFVYRQPFPGPGYAIRIRGEVTKERLEKETKADKIILEELKKADLLKDVFMSFPVLTGAQSVAVKGDDRFFGEVICLRVVTSSDVMTSSWAKLPYELLQKISTRIVNEVPKISRVVYDITTKPPATMEWE